MKTKVSWLFIVLSFIGTCLVYPSLPNTIPTHWNFNGDVDSYSSRPVIFVLALLPVILLLLFTFLPKIDPKKQNYAKHKGAYSIIVFSIIILLIVLQWLTVLAALHIFTNMGLAVKLLIGVLFIIIGNYLTQLRMNYFIGIRFPWTLSSERVWRKTHRVGGIGFILLGIISIVTAFFNGGLSAGLFITSLIGLILIIAIYSYLEFQKETTRYLK